MSKTWFTADLHFGHKSILKFASDTRPNCLSVDDMNDKLMANWNSQVANLDHVYILGDLSFLSADKTELILQQLNGIKHLIKGNHDHWINSTTSSYFASIKDYDTYKANGYRAVLFHYPIYSWNNCHHGSFHLHGHTHGSVNLGGKSLDVGIDNRCNKDMMLWEWQDVIDYMSNKPITPHH